MRVFRGSVFVIVIAFMMVIFFGNSVRAFKGNEESFLKYSAANEMPFYYPFECDEDNDERKCVTPTGDQITWIGDSLSALAGEELMNEMFSGVDYGETYNGTSINDYIRSGKSINTNAGGPSALDILENIKNKGKLRPYLVFAVGANYPQWDLQSKEDIDKFLRLVGDETQVLILTSKAISPHDMAGGGYDNNNTKLKELGDSHSNITIADWASEVKDDYYIDDGVHYNSNGYKAYFEFIKSNLPKRCSVGLLPGDDNAEKIWNYFVKAGIDGISDNPAAISGILGNIVGEGSGDPLLYGGDYYGLFMVKAEFAPEFKKAVDDAGLGQYWHTDYSQMSNVPVEANDKALEIELDWLVNTNSRFKKGGEGYSFLNNISTVDEKKPENYSDLFVVSVE